MKTIHRIHKTKNFTSLSNAMLRNKSLGFAAKGIMSMMLSHSHEWEMTMERLVDYGGDSRRNIREAVHQLEASGYAVREYKRTKDGLMAGTIWNWHEDPVPVGKRSSPNKGQPTDQKPEVGKPDDRKPTCRKVVKHKNTISEEHNLKKCEVFKEEKGGGYSSATLDSLSNIDF